VHQYFASISIVDAKSPTINIAASKSHGLFQLHRRQHRSVYLAEQLMKRLSNRNGLEVIVRHLELEKMGK
jgi:hypothetical protein